MWICKTHVGCVVVLSKAEQYSFARESEQRHRLRCRTVSRGNFPVAKRQSPLATEATALSGHHWRLWDDPEVFSCSIMFCVNKVFSQRILQPRGRKMPHLKSKLSLNVIFNSALLEAKNEWCLAVAIDCDMGIPKYSSIRPCDIISNHSR